MIRRLQRWLPFPEGSKENKCEQGFAQVHSPEQEDLASPSDICQNSYQNQGLPPVPRCFQALAGVPLVRLALNMLQHSRVQRLLFSGRKKISQLEEIEQMFTRFWDRYKHIDANSPSFPARTIPIYIHGDEGRSLVKRPILIVAYQPIIGWGGEHRCNSTKHLCINSSLVGYMGNPRFKIHFLRVILTH